jgi:hypothetical protein
MRSVAFACAELVGLTSTVFAGCERRHSRPDVHRVVEGLGSDSLCADGRAIVGAWCTGARAWPRASPDEQLPSVLVGMGARSTGSESPEDAIVYQVRLTAIVTVPGEDGGPPGATFGALEPDDPPQTEELRRVAHDLEAPMTTGKGVLSLPPRLRAFLLSRRTAADPVSRSEHGWEWSGERSTSLRHGALWLAIERGSQGEVSVSLLTDRVR